MASEGIYFDLHTEIDPTNEDILKENARRVRAADAARREAS